MVNVPLELVTVMVVWKEPDVRGEKRTHHCGSPSGVNFSEPPSLDRVYAW